MTRASLCANLLLHTGAIDDTSDQATAEAAYTSYARVPLARDGTEWTVTGTSPASEGDALTVRPAS